MELKLDKHIIKIISLLILYYILLIWIYKDLISRRWSYMGFVNEANFDSFILSFIGVLLTIFTFILIDKKNQPSSIVMNLFNLLFFIPMYVFIAYKHTPFEFYLFFIFYQITLFLFYIFNSISFNPILPRSKNYFFGIIGFILLANLFINIYYNGLRIKIDLTDVYENRLSLRDSKLPSIFNYIKSTSYFVGIIALMYALKFRKWILVAFVILTQLSSFAFGASKTQFFSIFVSLIVYFFYSEKIRFWVPISLTLILIFSIIEFEKFNSSLISDIFIRRSLFVPSKISYNIFDFFEKPGREYLYLRGSIFRIFGFEDPYAAKNGFQHLIGYLYGGTIDTNANTGLVGNDYAQFGWLTIFIFPFLRVYFLCMFDYCAVGIDKRIIIVLSIFITFVYISGSLFTVLISNGILLVNYLLYTFPKENISRKLIQYQ